MAKTITHFKFKKVESKRLLIGLYHYFFCVSQNVNMLEMHKNLKL